LRFLFSFVAAAALSGAGAAAQEPAATTGDQYLERFLTEAATLQADFEQELRDAAGQVVETATGRLSLRRPNQFFWEYREPIEQIVLADGDNLWIYDVDLAQATVTPLSDLVEATPAMLLSGDAAVRDSFETLESFSDGGTEWVRLAPNTPGADFRSILIGFRAGELASLELLDGLDQTTRIEFSDVVVNAALPRGIFAFEPPRGVDVIGEPR
jgi:outer membrane lipoprotein carrier protein